ncbi:hypothetical protein [Winogradskyella ursingii]|uniref:hypothetical protein n=1 Tax=Winogradskyella ursingii TaxID=2686079 RepID=UPI0015CD0BA6|nr:hypothetical protein [Winogradskyella ursingii]
MKGLLFLIVLLSITHMLNSQSMERYEHIENDSIYLDFINPYHAPITVNITPLDSTKSFVKVKPYALLRYQDTLKNALIIPKQHKLDSSSVNVNRYVKFNGRFGDP